MEKQEIIEAFCDLSAMVARFRHTKTADCFCGGNPVVRTEAAYTFDREVFDFIRDAVEEKLQREQQTTRSHSRRMGC